MATLVSYALTTLADVKESLGIATSDTSQDNLIIRKINQATAMIESYCDRRFAATDYVNEEYDSTGTNQLVLKQRPIISLTSMGLRDSSFNEDDWDTTDADLYFADNNAGVIDLNFRLGGNWNRVRVSYRAGYEEIPFDLAEAAVMLASYLVENPTSGAGESVRMKQEGQRRVEYFNTNSNNSASGSSSLFDQINISTILDSYCNLPVYANK